jgi:two-component system response regulator NreC
MSSQTGAGPEDGAPSQPVRIVLAEDHQVVRRGLQLVLESEPGLTVVAQAGDVVSARRPVREHRPDVLVLDLNMPGGSSLELISKLRAEAPETTIVVLAWKRNRHLCAR